MRFSVLGMRSVAYSPSRAMSCAPTPAERTSCAPLPGFISTACTTVPSGMFASGKALPGRISAVGPASSTSPTASPIGARM
jgi:hypothetical protein